MKQLLRAHAVVLSLLVFLLFMSVAQLSAQNAPVYVSTAAGNQILTIQGGTVSVLCSGNNKFVPEDVVVGPDGLIYVANTTQDQIWRIDPAVVSTQGLTPSCVSGAGTEKIYDRKTTKKCTDVSGVQPPITSCPSAPEGPSFVSEPTANSTGSLDLVFNTHSSDSTQGVWVITGIASLPQGCAASGTCPAPVRIIQPFSTAGEGIEFDIPGNMLMVDSAGGNVLRKTAPPFPKLNSFVGAASSIINGLSSPVGVAVDTCNDILVTNGLTIQRYNPVGAVPPQQEALQPDQVSFNGSDIPRFMEVDSSDRLFVVTAADESGTGGKVWLINLSPAGTVAPCTLSAPTLIANLALLNQAKTVTNLSSGNALGLGLAPTDFTTPPQHFTAGASENTYLFGTSTVSVKCDSASAPFFLQITALKSRPSNSSQPEVTFNPLPLQCQGPGASLSVPVSNPVSLHYSSQHGYSTQYWEQACSDSDPTCMHPITDTAFSSICGDPNFHLEAGYFTLDAINFPGAAHAATDIPVNQIPTKPYSDCTTEQYWGNAGPGVDGGFGSRLQTKHVGFTTASLTQNGVITLKQPAFSNNPQFNIGTQNISVKFTLADSKGKPITNAVERLSIVRTSFTVNGVTTNQLLAQNVVSSNNSSFQNFFTPNGSGQYNYNVDTSFFTLDQPPGATGTYQITIWGNDAQPFTFPIVGTF